MVVEIPEGRIDELKEMAYRKVNQGIEPDYALIKNTEYKMFIDEISRLSANSLFPLYSAQEIDFILGAYQKLFPDSKSPALRRHLDLDRRRPWSLLTTDFHQVNSSIIEGYHMEREQLQLEGLTYEEAGQLLQKLCRKHPTIKISGSLGISPFTDEILLKTFQPDINQVWAIIGHDWYTIIPNQALEGDCIRFGSAHLVESRSPRRRYPIYTENPYYKWAGYYRLSLPTNLPSYICLLFLNLIPDLRPPLASKENRKEGQFPFNNSGLMGYPECVDGTVKLLSSLSANLELSAILCWGAPVRDAISRYFRINPQLLKNCTRLRIGKYNPWVLASHHPAARSKDFPEGRVKYYGHCWHILQSCVEESSR